MNNLEAYNDYESYVLQHVKRFNKRDALRSYKKTRSSGTASLEYAAALNGLTNKIEELLQQWAKENDVDYETFFNFSRGSDGWMERTHPGSFGWVIFQLYEKVLLERGLIEN